MVIGEQDGAFDLVTEAACVLKFAFRNCRLHRRAAQFVGKDFFTVEPVFNARTADWACFERACKEVESFGWLFWVSKSTGER